LLHPTLMFVAMSSLARVIVIVAPSLPEKCRNPWSTVLRGYASCNGRHRQNVKWNNSLHWQALPTNQGVVGSIPAGRAK